MNRRTFLAAMRGLRQALVFGAILAAFLGVLAAVDWVFGYPAGCVVALLCVIASGVAIWREGRDDD